jgi:hypothetical protein
MYRSAAPLSRRLRSVLERFSCIAQLSSQLAVASQQHLQLLVLASQLGLQQVQAAYPAPCKLVSDHDTKTYWYLQSLAATKFSLQTEYKAQRQRCRV